MSILALYALTARCRFLVVPHRRATFVTKILWWWVNLYDGKRFAAGLILSIFGILAAPILLVWMLVLLRRTNGDLRGLLRLPVRSRSGPIGGPPKAPGSA